MVIFAVQRTSVLKRFAVAESEHDKYCAMAWKLLEIGRQLQLFANRKWNTGFRLSVCSMLLGQKRYGLGL